MNDPKQRLLADTVEYLETNGAGNVSLRQLAAALGTTTCPADLRRPGVAEFDTRSAPPRTNSSRVELGDMRVARLKQDPRDTL